MTYVLVVVKKVCKSETFRHLYKTLKILSRDFVAAKLQLCWENDRVIESYRSTDYKTCDLQSNFFWDHLSPYISVSSRVMLFCFKHDFIPRYEKNWLYPLQIIRWHTSRALPPIHITVMKKLSITSRVLQRRHKQFNIEIRRQFFLFIKMLVWFSGKDVTVSNLLDSDIDQWIRLSRMNIL